MAHTTKVAVIGSGYWGKNLVRNYHQLDALGMICDKNEMVMAQFQKQYPDVQTCMAFSEVLSNPDVQGVVIATPAETHYAVARETLLAGKHVYVEKPLVLDEADGQALIDIAGQKNRILMVGHLLQYHPIFVKLRELAVTGELGRINYIYSNRLNLGKIRREENILWSFAPHDISMILSLAGEEPEKIWATGGYYLHKKIADVTTTHLEFPSGLQSHIFVSWLHPFKEQKLVVVGDKKMAVFDDTLTWSDKLLLYPHEIHWEGNIPVPAKADPDRVDVAEDEPLRAECKHFLECIQNDKKPITDGEEGLRVLKVLKKAQYSLDNNGQTDNNKREQNEGISAEGRNIIDENVYIHPTAEIDQPVEIGPDTRIWHFSHVLKNSRIGKGCNIGQNVVIGPDVNIGNTCKIQNNVSVYKGITLEDGVFCGPSMVFTNIYNPRAEIRKMDQVRPTLVRRGATLGANCTIICGVRIGSYALIGAGAVVTRDVPDHALVSGNPARKVGYVCACGEKLNENFTCTTCGAAYRFDENDNLISDTEKQTAESA